MSFKKKLSIGLSVCFTMIVALIIGFNLPKKDVKGGLDNPTTPPSADEVVKVDRFTTNTYKAENIVCVSMGSNNNINYSYTPDAGATTTKTTAYEYAFGNPMDVEMAVYLKDIDVTGVDVAYAYLDAKWDGVTNLNGDNYYTTQSIPVGDNSYKYIYVLVTPTSESIPVSFSSNLKWNYGRAQTITIGSNIGSSQTKVVVSGQEIDTSTYEYMTEPDDLPDGYYFDAWFLDENFTQLATFPLTSYGQPLYARYANIPQLSTEFMTYYSDYSGYVLGNCYYPFQEVPYKLGLQDVVVPTYYDDGTNGVAPVIAIGYGAFGHRQDGSGANITSISLPHTITWIGDGAFASCDSLTSIDLSNCINLTDMTEGSLFYWSRNLISVVLPSSLTSIDASTFAYCNSLTNVDFSRCTSLTKIDNSAFWGCTSLTSIDLSGCTSLTTINAYAFNGCTNLQEVKLSSSLTTLGSNVFYQCESLETISIPSGVTSIPDNAFYYCSSLESIDLSACTSLTSIGSSAFRGCSNLAQITIPKNVTSIGANAFDSCASLTNVVLPSGLTTLGAYAFNKCSELVNINLGDTNIASVGNYVFYSCDNISNIDIPNGVISIGNYAFSRCSNLSSIKIPTSIQTIGTYTFEYCDSLTDIDLSNCINLTKIEECAFSSCSLTSITIPANVTTIENYAFDGCGYLVEVYNLSTLNIVLGEERANGGVGLYAKVIHTSRTDPSIVQTIRDVKYYAYENEFVALKLINKNLTTIMLDDRITKIYDGAFSYCENLVSVNLSECDRLTIIEDYSFFQCVNLVNINFPEGVTSIGNYAFDECTSLTSITIPEGVTSIGDSAFDYCYSLISIDLSKCTNLINIGSDSFHGCYSLTSITIPASVEEIGTSAFGSCFNLVEVYNLSSLSIKAGNSSNGYVGYYAKVIHTSASEPSRVQTIDDMKYYVYGSDFIALAPSIARASVTSITLDSKTTAINLYAFYRSINLTSIDLSKCANLTSIGDYAFRDCSSLTRITIPANVTKIGRYAFYECGKLTSITFSDTSTWYASTSSSYTAYNASDIIDVSNASTNVTYFTSTYRTYYWYKVD